MYSYHHITRETISISIPVRWQSISRHSDDPHLDLVNIWGRYWKGWKHISMHCGELLNTFSLLWCLLSIIAILITHWGRVTHICVSKLTIIGSDNGLSPGRQAIIQTNAGISLIWSLGTIFIEILIENYTFSFMKMQLIMSSAKWRPFCVGLNVLKSWSCILTGAVPRKSAINGIRWQ